MTLSVEQNAELWNEALAFLQAGDPENLCGYADRVWLSFPRYNPNMPAQAQSPQTILLTNPAIYGVDNAMAGAE